MIWRIFIFVVVVSLPAFAAVQPYERMDDPALQARAEALYRELRCVSCQSQAIDSSNAPVAAALRAAVREQLKKGVRDKDVLAYMQERYGDVVLMKPPLERRTWGLWLMPVLVLVSGGLMVMRTLRGRAV